MAMPLLQEKLSSRKAQGDGLEKMVLETKPNEIQMRAKQGRVPRRLEMGLGKKVDK